MKTHRQHSEMVLGKTPPVACSSSHITFGGRCLNCGWNPEVLCIECKRLKEEKDMQKIFERGEGICKECWNFDEFEL